MNMWDMNMYMYEVFIKILYAHADVKGSTDT